MKAILTADGTATSETALCDACADLDANLVTAERHAGDDATGPWADCTGNDELVCTSCGAES